MPDVAVEELPGSMQVPLEGPLCLRRNGVLQLEHFLPLARDIVVLAPLNRLFHIILG